MLYHQPHNSVSNYAYNAYFYNNIAYQPHFHKNFELVYVVSGQVRCTAGDRVALLNPGEFALFLANEVHSLSGQGNSRCWIGVFSGDHVHTFEKQVRGKVGDTFVFTCPPATNAFLQSHLITQEQPPLYLRKACLYAVCHEFCARVPLHPQTDKSGLLMQAITDYIGENYNKKITLAHLAEKLGYNYHYLSRNFARIFSVSFTDFLNAYRLENALAMLNETDKDITRIAMESGFQSIRSFNHCFKTCIGVSPSQYRAQNQK